MPSLNGNLVGAKCVEQHGFSDALIGAYDCCIYIKIYCHDDSFVTLLVRSKARVSPIKPLSIPKLELQGGVLLAKFISQVHKVFCHSLRCHPFFRWANFMVALHWIHGMVNVQTHLIVEE